MKRLLVATALTFLLAFTASAQKPSPAPTPPDEVVKITTTLVQIDVTATDSKGKVVRDLKPEDFEIYENGKRQKLSNFSFVSAVREVTEQVKQSGGVSVPLPPVEIRPEQVRRTIALVVDDLTLSFESVYQVRRTLKKYVDEQMRDGDLVAIIRSSAGIGALQQFTSNKAQLYAAIDKVKWYPLGRGNIGAFAPIEPTPLEIARATGDSTVTEEDLEEERNFLQGFDDFRNATFAVGTLGALRFVISGMSELPGRKSVVLFSDGIRLFPRDAQGSIDSNEVFGFMRQLIDQANRSSVVFYTIDARGLQAAGITAQDQIISPTPQSIGRVLSGRTRELFDTQEGLVYLARETGGVAIINNNDLTDGVRRFLDDQSYYLIGYVPEDETFDPSKRRFNKLDVRVLRDDVKVRFRSGFINVASNGDANRPATAQTPAQAIQRALVSPFAVNDISLRLNALFGFDAKIGTFVRSLLHVKADDLKFTDEPDGMKKAVFEVLAISFGDNGVLVDQIAKSYTLRTDSRGFEKITREGFVYHFTFPVKKPGAYQFRVAIRDAGSEKVGSASQFIEVPNLKKNRLTLSGLVLEGFTPEQWKVFYNGTVPDAELRSTDPMADTSLRRFKRGSVLRYGYEIYNAKADGAGRHSLRTQVRVFRERTLVLDGKPATLDVSGQKDMARIKAVSAISLPTKMEPGDYVLQIIVFDDAAKRKNRIMTQFVQFEVLE
jgi:VWFA-related protein